MTTTVSRDIKRRLDNYGNLPSIPQIIVKIRQISENPKSSVADLANVILSDHQLTSRILRMANSPYYGDFAGKVTTVTHAIVLMGFRAVRNIAISMSIYGMVNKLGRNSGFDVTAFWTRSVACGVIAKFLAHRINQPELIEAAFIAGFMHDIGQVILAGIFPEDYRTITADDLEAPHLHKTEQILFEIDHMEAGGMVARKWNLPDSLTKAITDHHRVGLSPSQKSDHLLVDLVYLSDVLYAHLMADSPPTTKSYAAIIQQAQTLIGVSRQSMEELVAVCREQIQEIAQDLEIDIEREFERRHASSEAGLDDVYQQLSNKEVQLAFLQNATAALMEAKSVDEILQVMCETVYRGMQMGRVLVFTFDKRGSCFHGKVGFGLKDQDAVRSLSFPIADGLFRNLRDNGNAISVVGDDPEVYDRVISPPEVEQLDVKAFAAIPIKILDVAQ